MRGFVFTCFTLYVWAISLVPCRGMEKPSGDHPVVAGYTLDVTFTPEAGGIEGTAGVRFKRGTMTSPMTFYLHGELRVSRILFRDSELSFRQAPVYYHRNYSLIATRVTVAWERDVEIASPLVIKYEGYFNPSRARSPSDYMRIDGDGVLLRSYGYSLWFPTFLDCEADVYPVKFESVRLTVPAEFRLVFTGRKTGEKLSGGSRTTTWVNERVDIHDVQCSARPWDILEKPPFHIHYLPTPESRRAAHDILAFARNTLDAYAELFQTPYDSTPVYIMEMPRYGDISSHNATGISRQAWLQFGKTEWTKHLLAHELIHPFVKVSVKQTDPLFAVAIEGFPSYFYLLAAAAQNGEEAYKNYIRSVEENYLTTRKEAPAKSGWRYTDEKPLLQITPEEIGIYKDTYVLSGRVKLFFNHLRQRMGPEAFIAFTRSLFHHPDLTWQAFKQLVLQRLPGFEKDMETWLLSTEFPAHFRVFKP